MRDCAPAPRRLPSASLLPLPAFATPPGAGRVPPMPLRLPRAFVPLRHRVFRSLWLATLARNTGMWVQNTGAGWLMTSLDPSPVMVSLVQAASMLPVFLLALPAGALADILDRRRFLIGAQAWILVMALILSLL